MYASALVLLMIEMESHLRPNCRQPVRIQRLAAGEGAPLEAASQVQKSLYNKEKRYTESHKTRDAQM
jgi:hypothetical protein